MHKAGTLYHKICCSECYLCWYLLLDSYEYVTRWMATCIRETSKIIFTHMSRFFPKTTCRMLEGFRAFWFSVENIVKDFLIHKEVPKSDLFETHSKWNIDSEKATATLIPSHWTGVVSLTILQHKMHFPEKKVCWCFSIVCKIESPIVSAGNANSPEASGPGQEGLRGDRDAQVDDTVNDPEAFQSTAKPDLLRSTSNNPSQASQDKKSAQRVCKDAQSKTVVLDGIKENIEPRNEALDMSKENPSNDSLLPTRTRHEGNRKYQIQTQQKPKGSVAAYLVRPRPRMIASSLSSEGQTTLVTLSLWNGLKDDTDLMSNTQVVLPHLTQACEYASSLMSYRWSVQDLIIFCWITLIVPSKLHALHSCCDVAAIFYISVHITLPCNKIANQAGDGVRSFDVRSQFICLGPLVYAQDWDLEDQYVCIFNCIGPDNRISVGEKLADLADPSYCRTQILLAMSTGNEDKHKESEEDKMSLGTAISSKIGLEADSIAAGRISSQGDLLKPSQCNSAKHLEEFYVCPITQCLMEDPVFAEVIVLMNADCASDVSVIIQVLYRGAQSMKQAFISSCRNEPASWSVVGEWAVNACC